MLQVDRELAALKFIDGYDHSSALLTASLLGRINR
jgi:hypothetical protein